jgi:uncharacterized repeat protein (TIGR03803 family)
MSPLRLRASYGLIALAIVFPVAPAAAQVVILHSFTGATDGQNPDGALLLSGSTLFGMTSTGGSGGDGTIFQLATNGTGYAVTHSFVGGLNDGQNPDGSLIQSGTNLFGTTEFGGSAGNSGTVFKIGSNSTGFGIPHTFAGGPADGSLPIGSTLVQSGATFYGMTTQGGTANLGTVFKVNPDGTAFSVIHSFAGGTADGQHPSFSSVAVSGTAVYGVTPTGGAFGFGTVFSMNSDGSAYTLLRSFNAATGDAWDPVGSLTLSGSTVYGMTRQGGGGAGTIFKMNTDGTGFNIMHVFTGQPTGDGANPVGSLTLVGSTLFGTTPTGGADALGVLFGINTDGSAYNILHTFTGGPNDGANPGDVIVSGSTFYGMTGAGGSNNLGTVYSFTPVPEPSSFLLLAVAGSAAIIARRRCKR